jgi:hypothetical protein
MFMYGNERGIIAVANGASRMDIVLTAATTIKIAFASG